MPEGLEHLFSGLVQGVGTTKLALEKEKREKSERDEAQKLQVLTALLSTPGLKPEQRSDLFRMALDVASKGDKKITEGMSNMLGPLLMQQSTGQTGGVRPDAQGTDQVPSNWTTPGYVSGGAGPKDFLPPSQPAAPEQPAAAGSAGLPKLGSSGSGGQSRSLFYTPEEENQQAAQKAGMIAQATGEVDVQVYQKKLAVELEAQKSQGFKLTGFTEPSRETGLVTPVYVNELTQQVKYGTPVDPFTSLEAGRAIEVNKAQIALAREEGVGAILRGKGIDPTKATPEQRKAAEQGYAQLVMEDQQATITAKKAGAFQSIASGTAALDRSLEREQLDINKQMLDYNRQRDDYDKIGQQVQELVKQVETAKAEASEAFNSAMVIQQQLYKLGVDPEGTEVPDDAAAVEAGITPANYQLLIGKARAAISRARGIASSAATHFKGSVEAGNLEDEPGKWPYIKDIRQPFTYSPIGGLPAMPTTAQPNVGVDVGGKPQKQRKSSQIDVPKSLLDELNRP